MVWLDSGQQEQHRSEAGSPNPLGQPGPRSLGEQAVAVLVRRLVETTEHSDGDGNDDLFGEAQTFINFPGMLRNQLHQHAHKLHQSPFAADLLRIAYAQQTHLDWVTFSHLSPEVIGSALRSDSLKHARSISLCIDEINGTPTELVSVLATHTPPFDSLYLHQTPSRQTDQPTADLLAQLITHPQLARTPSLFLTGIFSTSLRRIILPSPHTLTPHTPFPIQHLFIRHTFDPTGSDDDVSDDGNDSGHPAPPIEKKSTWPEYYYLGDTPYRPERFATGFLRLLHALAQGRTTMRDPDIASDLLRDTLCWAPPSLRDDLFFDRGNDERAASRVEITPLPCENRSIPWLAVGCGVPREVLFRGECWPLVRELDPEAGWSVVVDVVEVDQPMASVSYAFVKGVEGEEKVRVVGGLREFLGEAAPEVEGGLLDRRWEELERSLARRDARLAERNGRELRSSWVDILGDGEAREMLDELLLDAKTFGRNMLKVAMLARPEGELS